MEEDVQAFLAWETASRDVIDVKRIYIDVAGDLVAGVLLSQLVYWWLPNKVGDTKLRIERDGKTWLAKGRDSWWAECRITPKQFDRAVELLVKCGVVSRALYKYDGAPMVHLSLDLGVLSQLVSKMTRDPENPFSPKVEIQFDQRSISSNKDVQRLRTENAVIDARGTVVTVEIGTTQPAVSTIPDWSAFNHDPDAQDQLGDGTRRLTDREIAVQDWALTRLQRIEPSRDERVNCRRLFMQGCSPESFAQLVDDVLNGPSPPAVTSLNYFIAAAAGRNKPLHQTAAASNTNRGNRRHDSANNGPADLSRLRRFAAGTAWGNG